MKYKISFLPRLFKKWANILFKVILNKYFNNQNKWKKIFFYLQTIKQEFNKYLKYLMKKTLSNW